MQAQVKYESEVKTAVFGDRTITVRNLTPVLSPQEQDKRNREIERRLIYRGDAGSVHCRIVPLWYPGSDHVHGGFSAVSQRL